MYQDLLAENEFRQYHAKTLLSAFSIKSLPDQRETPSVRISFPKLAYSSLFLYQQLESVV